MRATVTCLLAFFAMVANPLFSQNLQDAVVKISASVDLATPKVTITWDNPAPSNLTLFRREKDADTWFVLSQVTGNTATSFVDNMVTVGQTYEYGIQRQINGVLAFGYVTVPLETSVVDQRGVMSVFVEAALETPLAVELERLRLDLIGDGWQVLWHSVPSNATVASVKSQIVADYNTENINAVFLFGEMPVPYAGNTAWDGHPEHQGAWPADTYYGDIQSAGWTDNSVNTANNGTAPGRTETVNIPGDGKFDNSIVPSDSELAVGRVDFSNLSEMTFGTTRTELYRRYLNKNHNWRTKQYTVENKALVDDNFGYFGGEAFAANGYRNANPLVGISNVQAGDFFNDTDDGQSFLFAYGCGAGSYTSANGVGTSAKFASDTVNAVFVQLFGSYHGDWDNNNNPFMMSALASKGGILTCGWAGRPHWFTHHLGAGETMGYSALATQNSCDNPGYFGSFGECGAHVTLLGDPSVRAQIVAPVSDLVASQNCSDIELTWAASPQTEVLGYHVYRSSALNAQYTRLTTDLTAGLAFTDDAPLTGDNFYLVKAVVREETPSGIFFNTSTGISVSADFAPATPPTITLPGSITLNCANPTYVLDGVCEPGIECTLTNLTVGGTNPLPFTITQAGSYAVTAVDTTTGCTTVSQPFTVGFSFSIPNPSASLGSANCAAQAYQLMGSSAPTNVSYAWSGPGGFTSNMQNPLSADPGTYTLTVTNTNNGCTATTTVDVPSVIIPNASAMGGTLTCSASSAGLIGSSTTQNVTYSWTGPNGFTSTMQNTTTSIPGTYLLTVTSTSGCTATATAIVVQEGDFPQAAPTASGSLTCVVSQVTLMANPEEAGFTFVWNGPASFNSPLENPTVNVAGEYFLQVTNPTSGCVAYFSVIVNQNNTAPNVNLNLPDLVLNCTQSTLTVDFSSICTLPGLACTLNGQPVTGPTTLDQSGSYELVVTQVASGCTVSDNFILTEDISIPTLTVTGDLTLECAGQTTTLTASSTTQGVTFAWAGLGSNATQTVPAGSYTVTATAPNGCITSQMVTVTAPPVLSAPVVTALVDCAGNSILTSSASGGTPPYSFQTLPPSPMPAGTNYTVVVTDANGCTASTTGTTTAPPPIEVTAAVTNVTVFGGNDGSATLTVTGGTMPYSYLWDNGQTTQTATNLSAGVHICVVTDANGCQMEVTIVVTEPTSNVEDNIPGLRRLALSPNPTDGRFALTLALESPLPVRVELLDVTGRILTKTNLENVLEKTWNFDLTNSPSGIYFCKIIAEGKVAVRKVVH